MEEKRKRFFPTVTLGDVATSLLIVAGAIGAYTTLYADVDKSKVEIANLKASTLKRDIDQETNRKEQREDLKEVKQDVKDLRNDVQTILLEVRKSSRQQQDRNSR